MDKTKDDKIPVLCSQRWILAYVGFLGFCVAFSLRDNVNVAVVCMVKTNVSSVLNSTSSEDQDCVSELQVIAHYNDRAEFEWDSTTKSAILASFFYGYVVTQIPGGWLADRYGGKQVLGYALLSSAFLTTLMPVCARTSVYLVCLVRGMIGLMQAVTVPAMHSMWSRWAPVLERSKLTTLCYAGTGVGSTLTLFISGLLCDYGFDNGWGSVFYLTGITGIVWAAIWFYTASNSPGRHPRLSTEERLYIEQNTDVKAQNKNGALSAIPYIGRFVCCIFAGHLADALRSRGILSTTATRKLMQAICVMGAQICLIATGFCSCHQRISAVILLSLSVTFTGFERAGFFVNHIDFARRYSGVLFGITNTVATVPGMIAPIIAGILTPNNTQREWRNVFYVCAGLDIFGMIIFALFGSGEIQDWAKDISNEIYRDRESVPGSKTVQTGRSVRVSVETVEGKTKQPMNMTLRYGLVNLAFDIEPLAEPSV